MSGAKEASERYQYVTWYRVNHTSQPVLLTSGRRSHRILGFAPPELYSPYSIPDCPHAGRKSFSASLALTCCRLKLTFDPSGWGLFSNM